MDLLHYLDVNRMQLTYGSTIGYISAGSFTFWDLDTGKK